MDTLRKDLVYALRSLRRQPGFTIVTLLTLALGIGANTAVFSVLNGVVLRPLGYPEPEKLQFVTSQFPGLGFDQFWVSIPEYVEYRDRNQVFQSIGAYQTSTISLDTNPPSRPTQALVTPELLPTLGVPPIAGRWFTAADSEPSAEPVLILSSELWRRAYGGQQSILNQTVLLNNLATRVVGIMPMGFDVHDQHVELYQPLTINPATLQNFRGNHGYYLIGRLKPGLTRQQALADLDLRLKEWPTLNPGTHAPSERGHRLRIDPLKEDMIGSVRLALVVLQAAVGFVLLIACANLANLLIARADSRVREYAVRTALGASRGRLLRQLITEGLVLSVTGAALGIGLAWGGLRLLLSVNPAALPRTTEIALDVRVLLFTVAIAIGTALVFGIVPLLHLGSGGIGQTLKDSGNRSATGSARARLRSALVVAEVALAVLLVVGAGLLLRSFINLTRVDMGFSKSALSTFGVVLPAGRYNPDRRIQSYAQLSESLQRLPGVQSVGAASGLPPQRNVNANDTDFEHIPDVATPPGQTPQFPPQNVDFYQFVTLGYLTTMGIQIAKGRGFELQDTSGAAPVALVNETLVKKFFTDRDPIGQRVKPGFGDSIPWFTIVGVVHDVKQGGVGETAGTELYMLADQLPKARNFAPGSMNFVIRSSIPLADLGGGFRRVVAELDPTLPVIRMRSMDEVVGEAIARPRFLAVLLGLFAGLALTLAAVGTYGILSYLVAERRQEIGIRMALGADRGMILRLVMRRGVWLSALGLAIGMVASIGLTRVMKTLLFNVQPIDPPTLAIVAGVMAVVAIVACLAPAWRAANTDPLAVLRN